MKINVTNYKPNWTLKIVCYGCGSLLEVEKEDIYGPEFSYYNGETVYPKCGRKY